MVHDGIDCTTEEKKLCLNDVNTQIKWQFSILNKKQNKKETK
jgi:hypothetical protein